MFRSVPGALACFGLTLASAAFAQAPAATAPSAGIASADGEDKITVNFVNADIQSVIKAVGQQTGRNFILDPRVSGTVNIVSERPVSRDLLYQIFLSALRVQGYAAVESDGFVKIVPEAEAKTSAGPVGERAARIPGDRIVTQVFTLQNENAVQLVPVLRPLVTANNFIGAYPPNNAIIITDYATNVRRIGEIIRSIDLPVAGDVQVIRLQNASAIDIASILQRVVPETLPSPTAPGSPAKAAIAVDPRTNSLIVRGDSPALISRIKTLAAGLDTPGAGAGNIFVVPLRNGEATKIAETLRALLSGESASRSTSSTSFTPAGAPSGTTPATTTSTSTGAGSTAAPPASTIQAYQPTNSLIITAPEPVYRNLRAVIDRLDERRAQVFVEALVVELTLGKAAEFGVQWQGLANLSSTGRGLIGGTNFSTAPGGLAGTNILGATGALSGTLAGLSSLGPGLNLGVVNGTISVPNADGTGFIQVANLGVLARAFEGDSNSNVLSTPNILTLDNEEAKLLVGQNVPFITGSYTPTAGSAANPFQTIERKDIGITLRVRPTITEAGTVKLALFEEVSSVTNDKTLVQSADIITNKRSLETTVLADDGQIVVLGGLIQDDRELNIDKIPLLGDIPYLGALFRYQSRTHRRTNLMIFLRPVVLKDANAARPLTAERYEYIRNLQSEIREPRDVVLAPQPSTQLPPLPEMQGRQLIGK